METSWKHYWKDNRGYSILKCNSQYRGCSVCWSWPTLTSPLFFTSQIISIASASADAHSRLGRNMSVLCCGTAYLSLMGSIPYSHPGPLQKCEWRQWSRPRLLLLTAFTAYEIINIESLFVVYRIAILLFISFLYYFTPVFTTHFIQWFFAALRNICYVVVISRFFLPAKSSLPGSFQLA